MSAWVDRGTHRTFHTTVLHRPSDGVVGRQGAVAAAAAVADDCWIAAGVVGAASVAGAAEGAEAQVARRPSFRHCLKPEKQIEAGVNGVISNMSLCVLQDKTSVVNTDKSLYYPQKP